MTKEPELILVARSAEVSYLIDRYAKGELSFSKLSKAFHDRGWSTLNLYEFVRDIKVEKKT